MASFFEDGRGPDAYLPASEPLAIQRGTTGPARISIVTDSLAAGHFYGGVGTALILGALLAEASNARLRIVTRGETARGDPVPAFLKMYGLSVPQGVEYAFSPFYDAAVKLPVVEGERFITTSWWTTTAVSRSVDAGNVVYLLQEDERMFYEAGYEQLLCARMLANPGLRFVVNSKLLFDHLVASGLANVARNGTWFEPAFPSELYHRRTDSAKKKPTLMFYARPKNVRNLFRFGLEVLETALNRGVIDAQAWRILFVGRDIPRLTLNCGQLRPERLENLAWADYAALVGSVDLGLSLMYTPHPSYPPLDLAASGAVCVTNAFGNKRDLTSYSPNILCAEPQLDAMVDALREGVKLALDEPRRERNFAESGLGRDWRHNLAPVIAALS